ncbi:MAG: hypothetical protein R3332_02265 [Pseudohongiellaceae bacterium]|nr:hypothetical protein [Pseudohongiellaceae bacterium]
MPNAIIAIRRYPAALLLALALFLSSLVIAAVSFGKTGGGGDDEGSGFGGTGKTGEFGGSGLGGTGMPSPLVLIEADQTTNASHKEEVEVASEELDPQAIQAELVLEFDMTIPQRPEPSSSIVLELNSSLEERAKQQAESAEEPQGKPAPLESIQPQTQVAEAPSKLAAPSPAEREEPIAPAEESIAAANEETTQDTDQKDRTAFESRPAQVADSQDALVEGVDESRRIDMPERIQRPELPPVQRVRPVERISIAPPRAQPMRI